MPVAAEPDPIYRDSMVVCPDGTRARLTLSPGANRPSADQMRTLCSFAGAANGRQPPRMYPGKFGGGILVCSDGKVMQRLDWSEGANWPVSRLYALCGLPDPNAASAAPAVPNPMSKAEIEARFNRGLVPLARPRSDMLSSDVLDRLLRPPRPLFTFTRAELDGVAAGCVDQAIASNIAAAAARRFCACTTRSVQFAVTREEWEAYGDWQVWKTSWRRHFWTVAKPAGVEQKLAAGASQCGRPG